MREGADARLVEQFGADACRRLGDSWLAVIGAGTLGGAFSAHAAMLGVRHRIVDVARIEPQNLGA